VGAHITTSYGVGRGWVTLRNACWQGGAGWQSATRGSRCSHPRCN